MFASFHQLFTFHNESKAKNKENFPCQKLLEFSKTESISSKLSKATNFSILKRPFTKIFSIKNHAKPYQKWYLRDLEPRCHKDTRISLNFFDLYIVCYQENKSNPCELVGVQKQKNDFPRSSVIFKNGHISAIFWIFSS